MKKLTKEECIEIGGHCWVIEGMGNPHNVTGEITPRMRYCVHCGLVQHPIHQPAILWVDNNK